MFVFPQKLFINLIKLNNNHFTGNSKHSTKTDIRQYLTIEPGLMLGYGSDVFTISRNLICILSETQAGPPNIGANPWI